MDFDPMTLPPAVRSGMYTTMQLGARVPLANPQPAYKEMVDEGGLHCPFAGVAMTFVRDQTEFVLRNHALFSSAVEMPLGNIRPLIPLNIDPPQACQVPQDFGSAICTETYGRIGKRHRRSR
jgi:hypothetical protein